MDTRLDSLFTLLAKDASSAARKMAAQQIGQVQSTHPHFLQNLLERTHVYLLSQHWDTRVAAKQALGYILKHVPPWSPPAAQDVDTVKVESLKGELSLYEQGRFSFDKFDFSKLISSGKRLLGSSGAEYDREIVALSKEQLAIQRKNLEELLGADLASSSYLTDEDLTIKQTDQIQASSSELIDMSVQIDEKALSARMRNRTNRKKKAKQSTDSLNNSQIFSNQASTKSVVTDQPGNQDKVVIESVIDVDAAFEDAEEWPLARFSDELTNELFDHRWYIRQGAAMGLQEILNLHQESAGKKINTSIEVQQRSNQEWLEDCSVRLLCILILDRFEDYAYDKPISPVRETCSQTLAVLINKASFQFLDKLTSILYLMADDMSSWQVRHSAYLVFMYLIALRMDYTKENLDKILTRLLTGLEEDNVDVQGVVAKALHPLVQTGLGMSIEVVKRIYDIVWRTLDELDDLTGATANVMELIAELCTLIGSSPELIHVFDLGKKIPKLWPFFRYTLKSVRSAVLMTLQKIITTNFETRSQWLPPILSNTMQLLFQNIILEQEQDIIDLTMQVWNSIINAADITWTEVAEGLTYNQDPAQGTNVSETTLLSSTFPLERLVAWFKIYSTPRGTNIPCTEFLRIGFGGTLNEKPRISSVDRREADFDMYLNLASAFSDLAMGSSKDFRDKLLYLIQVMIVGRSATEKSNGSLIVIEWANKYFRALEEGRFTSSEAEFIPALSEVFVQTCESVPDPQILYSELDRSLLTMRNECKILVDSFHNIGVQFNLQTPTEEFTVAQAKEFITSSFNSLIQYLANSGYSDTKSSIEFLNSARTRIFTTIEYIDNIQDALHITASSCICAAVVAMRLILAKMNPVIRPLLRCLKKEAVCRMQMVASNALAWLTYLAYASHRVPCSHLISNILEIMLLEYGTHRSFLRFSDLFRMLEADSTTTETGKRKAANNASNGEPKKKIKTEKAAAPSPAPSNTSNNAKNLSLPKTEETDMESSRIAFRGVEMTLKTMARLFGPNLFAYLPMLWELIDVPLRHTTCTEAEQKSVSIALLIIATIADSIDESLKDQLMLTIELICPHLMSSCTKIQAAATYAIASVVKSTVPASMETILAHLIPMLQDATNHIARRGAALAICSIIEVLDLEILPYLIFFVIPVLGRMSDQDPFVRKVVSFSFGNLIKIMPLEANVPNPPGMPESLAAQRLREREFLEQLFGGRKILQFDLPVRINADLRVYQQEGINWLQFLNLYNLHGILADDMGLGKTLQTICIIFADYEHRMAQYKLNPSPEFQPLPSLVVCPPILIDHWINEVNHFCDTRMKVIAYRGSSRDREMVHKNASQYQLIVTSYEILRKDIDSFKMSFNYCVLDEGHIIRNPNSKITQAIKHIQCNRRLILTGTPIQNNVLELWSLFDFLMPGFLGTQQHFTANYSKPVMLSRNAKASTEEQEKGIMALEALHRQVLPFILRRLKGDVLQDLPPKVIQDVVVELSPLQSKLYSEFLKNNQIFGENTESLHTFQALQYLRKLTFHPKLVLNTNHPSFKSLVKELVEQGTSLDDICHSAKLLALKELLHSCGIGIKSEAENDVLELNVVQSRVLIFSQLKQTLSIVENDLFKRHMPTVSYLKLDGDVPSNARMSIVDKFNSNPSIDVLLLTVSIGGLGLNLTGANIVIFLEHDWNPQNDIQAMDRVHRIGQKKTVNVYRLITKDTLEEKIMSLQKFKLKIADTVVNKENQSFQSMSTHQLLDLFEYSENEKKSKVKQEQGIEDSIKDIPGKTKMSGLKAILASLEEYDEQSKLAEEYDLNNFLANINTGYK